MSRRRPKTLRDGFTLLETIVSMAVLMLAILGITTTVWQVHSLREENQLRRTAENAARTMAQEIQVESAALHEDPLTWAPNLIAVFGAGGAIGPDFAVPGLDLVDGDAFAGSIEIVTDETTTDAAVDAELGLPRDLNGDGTATSADVSAEALLLPFVVQVRWRSGLGPRTIRLPVYAASF